MPQSYTPRRQSKRWLDGNCPRGVLAIYDNRGQSADRYTVFYAETYTQAGGVWLFGRAMSDAPFHPCGVGLSIEMEAYQVSNYRYRFKRHAARWSDLPEDVKRCVRQDLNDSERHGTIAA